MMGKVSSVDTRVHTQATTPDAPVLACFLGRQRIGKSVAAWGMASTHPERRTFRVWDFDPAALQEDGRTLSWLMPSAMKPDRPDDQSRLEWLRTRTDEVIGGVLDGKPYDVYCDFGGVEEMLKRFAGKFQFVKALEEFGVRVVAIHVVGPDPADLRFLREVESTGTFKPSAAALLMNEAMVHEDRDPEEAFSGVYASPTVTEFRARGGVTAALPLLFQMQKIAGPGGILEQKWDAKPPGDKWTSIPLRDFTIASTGLGHLEARLVKLWLDEKVPTMRERLAGVLP